MANQERFYQVVRIVKGAAAGFLTLAAVSCASQEQITATSEPIRIGSGTPSALRVETPTIPPLPTFPKTTDILVYVAPTIPKPTIPATPKEKHEVIKREFRNILGVGTSTWWRINQVVLHGKEAKVPSLGDRSLVARGEIGKRDGVMLDQVIENIKEMKDLNRFDAVVLYGWQNDLLKGDSAGVIYKKLVYLISYLKIQNPNMSILLLQTPPTSVDDYASQGERNKLNDMFETGEQEGLFHLVRTEASLADVIIGADGQKVVRIKTGLFDPDGLHPNIIFNDKEELGDCGVCRILADINDKLNEISTASTYPTQTPPATLRNK